LKVEFESARASVVEVGSYDLTQVMLAHRFSYIYSVAASYTMFSGFKSL